MSLDTTLEEKMEAAESLEGGEKLKISEDKGNEEEEEKKDPLPQSVCQCVDTPVLATESASEPPVLDPSREAAKLNCWEYKKCGREPGGTHAGSLGPCPVPLETSLDGLHGGKNAGRSCWALVHKKCSTAECLLKSIKTCTQCDFHYLVIKEEEKYQSALSYLKKSKKEEKEKFRGSPGFVRHIYEKSKHTAFEDSFEVESFFITMLIGWVSLCPSVSMLEGSKRLCKDDLVDELMVIDAIADGPRRKALKTVAKTMLRAVTRQVGGYFDPLFKKVGIADTMSNLRRKKRKR